MTNRLIFVRLGIRGIKNPNKSFSNLPFFNEGENLSLYGHILSLKLGKFIKEKIGTPEFIYADNSVERTIASAIAFAKGSCENKIFLCETKNDPYFENQYKYTENDIELMKLILINNTFRINKIADYIKIKFPYLHLDTISKITTNGKVKGLIEQIGVMSQIPSFSHFSKIKLDKNLNTKFIEEAYTIKQKIIYIPNVINEQGDKLLNGIKYLLQKYNFSVLIGHDENNISVLAEFMGLTFHSPGYSKGFIPPNSGFIFTLKENNILVEIIFINLKGYYEIIEYKTIAIPNNLYIIDKLIKKNV